MQTLQVNGTGDELQVDAVPNLLQVDGGSDIVVLDSLGVTMTITAISRISVFHQPQIVVVT